MTEDEDRELVYAYKRLFNSDDGKIVLANLEEECGFNKSSVRGEINLTYTLFLEGKRWVYLWIQSMLRRKTNERDEM